MKKTFILFTFLFLYSSVANACKCLYLSHVIDSIEQLKSYDFIAHVNITKKSELRDFKGKSSAYSPNIQVQVLELFKGKPIKIVYESLRGTSCDLGTGAHSEWILFGKMVNGKMTIGPCDRNILYRQTDGTRDWKYGHSLQVLKRLQQLYKHTDKTKQGTITKNYKNGKPELTENYVNGKLQGERKIYYPNGRLMAFENYINDTLSGSSLWYYPTGQLQEEAIYVKGVYSNVLRVYYDYIQTLPEEEVDVELDTAGVYKLKMLYYEIVYDHKGNPLMTKEYAVSGKLQKEELVDFEKGLRSIIEYHPNGRVASISHTLNHKLHGPHMLFDEDGKVSQSGTFNENGELIPFTK